MKTIRFLYLLLLGTLAIPVASDAQIADNDASISVLAVQCAVSSGFSAGEYEDYCRRLAKTLSMLSSAQQTRVFGYLPMPGAASLGDSTPETSAATGSTESDIKSPAESNSLPASTPTSGSNEVGAKETTPATTPTQSNSILDMVGRFNSLFDGTASVSASTPVVSAGVNASVGENASSSGSSTLPANLGALVSANATASNGSNSNSLGANANANTGGALKAGNSGSSNGWNSLVAWFQAAEAAYKAGTLSSFLKGGN